MTARDFFVAARLEREIAFRVQSHRPVAEIRRAYPQPFIVDDHHLGMHVDAGALFEAGRIGIVDTETARPSAAQFADQRGFAARASSFLEPAVTQQAEHHDDFRTVGLAEAFRERVADVRPR